VFLQDRCVVGCGRRVAAGVCGQCDGNGGVRAAGVWRLHKTYKTYKTYKIMIGAPVFALTGYAVASHVIPRGFAVPRCGWAWVQIYRWGVPGFFYGNGGVRAAWAWRLHLTCLTCLTCLTRWVRRCIPRGVAVPLCGMGLGADLPMGCAGLFLWQRWCACCGGVTLVSDLSDLSDLSDKMGAPLYTPRVCCAAVWYGFGCRFTDGVCKACFMATVVCVLRGRGACIRRIRLIRLIFNDEGAPRYTPRVCGAAVWFGAGENVPVGDAGGTHGQSGGVQRGSARPPLAGQQRRPATRFFLPSFFFYRKKSGQRRRSWMASSDSSDLRLPLTVLRGSAEMASRGVPGDFSNNSRITLARSRTGTGTPASLAT